MFLFSSYFDGVFASLQISGNYIEQHQFDFLFRDELAINCEVNMKGNEFKSSRSFKFLKFYFRYSGKCLKFLDDSASLDNQPFNL